MSFITTLASYPQNWKNKAIPVPERLNSEKNHFQANPLCCQRPWQRLIPTLQEDGYFGGGLARRPGSLCQFF